jgi:tetratricopeptide (TPR) repeat protein
MNDLSSLCLEADEAPTDLKKQLAAAYACDREGDEARAVIYYDIAWKLGLPDDERLIFIIGYGSTLKNVGRLDESERMLRQAILEAPNNKAIPAFLALTLHAMNRNGEAIAVLLDSLLSFARQDENLADYGRALGEYRDMLRGVPVVG